MDGQRALLKRATLDRSMTTGTDEVRHQVQEHLVAGRPPAATVHRQDEPAGSDR